MKSRKEKNEGKSIFEYSLDFSRTIKTEIYMRLCQR